MNKWDGREYDPDYVRKIFNEGNLPPGQEIIKDLSERFSEMGYQEIRINVSMKNWSALRYWIKSGFNKTTGLYGDLEYSVNNFANIELIKSL